MSLSPPGAEDRASPFACNRVLRRFLVFLMATATLRSDPRSMSSDQLTSSTSSARAEGGLSFTSSPQIACCLDIGDP